MREYVWRLYRHPITEVIIRVHLMDMGLAAVYERWGWIELRGYV